MDVWDCCHSWLRAVEGCPVLVCRDIFLDILNWSRAGTDPVLCGTAVVAVGGVDVAHCSNVAIRSRCEVVNCGDIFSNWTAVGLRVGTAVGVDDGCECDVWIFDGGVCEFLPFVLVLERVDVERNENIG